MVSILALQCNDKVKKSAIYCRVGGINTDIVWAFDRSFYFNQLPSLEEQALLAEWL